MVDIYRDDKRPYLSLGTDPEGENSFSIYQNNGIKMHALYFQKNNTM